MGSPEAAACPRGQSSPASETRRWWGAGTAGITLQGGQRGGGRGALTFYTAGPRVPGPAVSPARPVLTPASHGGAHPWGHTLGKRVHGACQRVPGVVVACSPECFPRGPLQRQQARPGGDGGHLPARGGAGEAPPGERRPPPQPLRLSQPSASPRPRASPAAWPVGGAAGSRICKDLRLPAGTGGPQEGYEFPGVPQPSPTHWVA